MDATAVSTTTRAQKDFRRRSATEGISSKTHLDIFVKMRGKTLNDFRPTLRFFESEGVRIAYLSPEDLIFLKGGSWREKDQIDVAAMKEIIAREGRQGA